MFFTVLPAGGRPAPSITRAFLITDQWDDWFTFETMYSLVVYDSTGLRHNIGSVKIGKTGLEEDVRRPKLKNEFESLEEGFFSLGQDDSYYEDLKSLGPELRDRILSGLRDVAADESLFESVLNEDVMQVSLLRHVSPVTVRGQFRRLARGDARLTRYKFRYRAPAMRKGGPSVILDFDVEPESHPPTNIHVLIGRNGVGKTHLLRRMARAIVNPKESSRAVGRFEVDEDNEADALFANLVSVTFSAFDPFQFVGEQESVNTSVRYSYIGLQRPRTREGKLRPPKSTDALSKEFVASVRACRVGAERRRWLRALTSLETDPLFSEAEVSSLAHDHAAGGWEKRAVRLFRRLSSGHKVVLLTITRLVESVDERTLVLLDEPEAHLHPPLLSAFVRALSDLLVQRNGVAIIATHSPVVLQEVPRTCAWKLRRSGALSLAERPELETFGENVGVLTREVFGFEVTDAGFHRMLVDAVKATASFEEATAQFDDQLGAEARAIVRALAFAKQQDGDITA